MSSFIFPKKSPKKSQRSLLANLANKLSDGLLVVFSVSLCPFTTALSLVYILCGKKGWGQRAERLFGRFRALLLFGASLERAAYLLLPAIFGSMSHALAGLISIVTGSWPIIILGILATVGQVSLAIKGPSNSQRAAAIVRIVCLALMVISSFSSTLFASILGWPVVGLFGLAGFATLIQTIHTNHDSKQQTAQTQLKKSPALNQAAPTQPRRSINWRKNSQTWEANKHQSALEDKDSEGCCTKARGRQASTNQR